jgi:hypothetical protein
MRCYKNMGNYLCGTLVSLALAIPLSAQWLPLHSQDFETSMAPWTHGNGLPIPNPPGWPQ